MRVWRIIGLVFGVLACAWLLLHWLGNFPRMEGYVLAVEKIVGVIFVAAAARDLAAEWKKHRRA